MKLVQPGNPTRRLPVLFPPLLPDDGSRIQLRNVVVLLLYYLKDEQSPKNSLAYYNAPLTETVTLRQLLPSSPGSDNQTAGSVGSVTGATWSGASCVHLVSRLSCVLS
jgi:hypothetical protein